MNKMRPHHKSIRVITLGLLWLWVLLVFAQSGFSQDDTVAPIAMTVGVIMAPPLAIKAADGQWQGFGVELWQALAQQIDIPYKFKEFNSLERLTQALEKREIDIIPAMAVRDQLVSVMDFSQSYMKSGLSIAVPAEGVELSWFRVAESIFSKHILKAVGLLMSMSLIAGIIVWLFERRRNSDMFGRGISDGIGQGIWWAMVTMTTVGYGDKAPKTLGGRTVALVWMIFSIVFIASFTANITASLTISELKGKVRGFNDLYHAKVGSVSGSAGFNFLTMKGIGVIPFENFSEALIAVADKRIDAFVNDGTILRDLAKTEFPGQVLILPGTFDEYFVSIALKLGSPKRKAINKALLKFMKTEKWTELQKRYLE